MSTTLLIFSLLLLSFSTMITPSLSAFCDANDQAVLLEIKQQFGNPEGLSTWVEDGDCCSWAPTVGCTDAGRINLIALFNLNVSVPVPTAFGDLSELRTLQLDSMPGMSGPIPTSFARLSQLEVLDITGTGISGPVPAFLSMTNLNTLALFNNKLSGSIPQSFTSMSNLRYLDLSGNSITGTIPPGLLHGNSRFLVLTNNQLTGQIPTDYGDPSMDTIDVSRNGLIGDALFLFGAAKTMMVKIDLSWNAFDFDMTKIVFPPQLAYLDLSHNKIKGGVPKSIKNVSLGYLDVSNNLLCGQIPTGQYMAEHDASCYANNKCLCGTPLPPCARKKPTRGKRV